MGAIDDAPLLRKHRLTAADYHRMGEVGLFAPEARVASHYADVSATETPGLTPIAALEGVTIDLAGVLG